MRIIGNRKDRTPQERHRIQEKLIRSCNALRPYKKRRGIILKFKTWEELDQFNRTRAARKI